MSDPVRLSTEYNGIVLEVTAIKPKPDEVRYHFEVTPETIAKMIYSEANRIRSLRGKVIHV